MKTPFRASNFPSFLLGMMAVGLAEPVLASPNFAVGSAAGAGGTTVSVPVNFSAGSTGVASLQFTFGVPSGWSIVSASAGTSATTASKTVAVNTSNGIVIVYGLNTIAIGSGDVVDLQIGIPASAAAGSNPLTISGATYSDANATNVPGTASSNGSVNVYAYGPSPVITSALNVADIVGTIFNYQIAASNSPTSFNANGLPSGLSINTASGLISGTPSAAGTYSVALSAFNGGGTGSATLILTINSPPPPAPVVTSAANASAIVGTAFNYQITASNNPASFNASGLPAGLSVDTTSGRISGIPSVSGNVTISISATNSGGTGSIPLTLTVTNPLPGAPVITGTQSAAGVVGVAFSYQITASNNPTGFSATGLPPGVSVNTGNGLLSGTPRVSGSYSTTLSASNAGGVGSAPLSISIDSPLSAPFVTSAANASAVIGAAFTYQITASNNPTSFYASGLPPGLSVDTTSGRISGSPSASGNFPISISATNSGGTGSAPLNLTVSSPPPVPVVTSAQNAAATVGTAFTYQITASNNPTSFSASGLPSGLSLNSASGLLSGTPSASGIFTISLNATNSGGTGTLALVLTVTTSIVSLPSLSVGMSSGAVGTNVLLPITFASGSAGVSSLQFTLVIPADWTLVSASTGAASFSADKSVSMNASNGTVIVFGVNQNLMLSGVVATIVVGIATDALAGSVPVTITQAVYRDPNGLNVSAGPSQAGSIVVESPLTAPGSANPIPEDLSSIRVYPNPWRSDKNAAFPWVKFDLLPSGSTVKIFTASGRPVKTLWTDASGIARWDRTNYGGDIVASGLYIYLVKDPKGNKRMGKMAVIQ